ncbi:MAG: branched-chain amino acid aminotransferase [Aestuariivita sp.]|nr:branched-chain amino acid aminotransferase [Aestuariivita sp.]MCY4202441.1 branched-chain amino acid aminotransferase [Aestuariivita sp.]
MAFGKNIKTYFEGSWHNEDLMIMRAADHGSWLGSTVFDGARYFERRAPDLRRHCQRLNNSAKAMMMVPSVPTEDMIALIQEGFDRFATNAALYIRPMYWAIEGDTTAIVPDANKIGFAVCLEEVPMSPLSASVTLTRTRFRRPVLESSVVNAKSGCLYPNNARMLAEARSKGFHNALVADAMGNVAETATANIFMVKDGEVFTPIANGTFLEGVTRRRHISNMRQDGIAVHETVLTFEDFETADEVFMSGNMSKVTPVVAFDDRQYQRGPMTQRVRELYWDWAASTSEP